MVHSWNYERNVYKGGRPNYFGKSTEEAKVGPPTKLNGSKLERGESCDGQSQSQGYFSMSSTSDLSDISDSVYDEKLEDDRDFYESKYIWGSEADDQLSKDNKYVFYCCGLQCFSISGKLAVSVAFAICHFNQSYYNQSNQLLWNFKMLNFH